jgi:hypothetical protein
MRDGTSLITIFLVTLRRLNVRPFLRSPGLIVGFSWIDRKDLFVTNIHVRTKEVEEHIPRPQKPSLVDASEETCQVLVEQAEIAIDWSFLGDL